MPIWVECTNPECRGKGNRPHQWCLRRRTPGRCPNCFSTRPPRRIEKPDDPAAQQDEQEGNGPETGGLPLPLPAVHPSTSFEKFEAVKEPPRDPAKVTVDRPERYRVLGAKAQALAGDLIEKCSRRGGNHDVIRERLVAVVEPFNEFDLVGEGLPDTLEKAELFSAGRRLFDKALEAVEDHIIAGSDRTCLDCGSRADEWFRENERTRLVDELGAGIGNAVSHALRIPDTPKGRSAVVALATHVGLLEVATAAARSRGRRFADLAREAWDL